MIKQKQFFFSQMKSPIKLSILHREYFLKQCTTAGYLRCCLDSTLNGESLASRVFKKIKLNFLRRQSNYLNYSFRRLLCKAFIRPPFDYGCTSWYPFLSKTLKTKLQIAQNQSMRFWLELSPRGHINPSHFRKINWPPAERRVELCTSTTVFKYEKRIARSNLNDVLKSSLNNYNTRS